MSFQVYIFDIHFNLHLLSYITFLYCSGFSKGTGLTEWICLLKEELLGCSTECDLGSSPMTVSHWRGRESGRCSVPEAGCPIGPNMELKVWRIPRERLGFDLHWHPIETGSHLNAGQPLAGAIHVVVWVFLLQISWSRKSLTGVFSSSY